MTRKPVHVHSGGQTYGPYEVAALWQYLEEGRLDQESLVYVEEQASWILIGEFLGEPPVASAERPRPSRPQEEAESGEEGEPFLLDAAAPGDLGRAIPISLWRLLVHPFRSARQMSRSRSLLPSLGFFLVSLLLPAAGVMVLGFYYRAQVSQLLAPVVAFVDEVRSAAAFVLQIPLLGGLPFIREPMVKALDLCAILQSGSGFVDRAVADFFNKMAFATVLIPGAMMISYGLSTAALAHALGGPRREGRWRAALRSQAYHLGLLHAVVALGVLSALAGFQGGLLLALVLPLGWIPNALVLARACRMGVIRSLGITLLAALVASWTGGLALQIVANLFN